MTSPLGNLFLSLQAQIAALADGGGNKYFKFVDQDMGQLEAHKGDMRTPVLWPCALIDIDKMNFKSIGNNDQEGIGQVRIRLGFPPFSATSAATPGAYIQKALYYYDLEQILHQSLQGARPGDMSGFSSLLNIYGHYDRITSCTEHRHDTIRVRELVYSLGLSDFSTDEAIVYTPATLNLDMEFGV
jgi:hypothetical protein